jgi:hypothetical protein
MEYVGIDLHKKEAGSACSRIRLMSVDSASIGGAGSRHDVDSPP